MPTTEENAIGLIRSLRPLGCRLEFMPRRSRKPLLFVARGQVKKCPERWVELLALDELWACLVYLAGRDELRSFLKKGVGRRLCIGPSLRGGRRRTQERRDDTYASPLGRRASTRA
jgi:hypothetical protein